MLSLMMAQKSTQIERPIMKPFDENAFFDCLLAYNGQMPSADCLIKLQISRYFALFRKSDAKMTFYGLI